MSNNCLGRIQNKFVIFLLWKLCFPSKDLPHDVRLQLVGIESLQCFRQKALLLFLHKLLNGYRNCEALLVEIKIPSCVTQSSHVFMERYHCTNYGCAAFCNRLMKNCNQVKELFPHLDVFNVCTQNFKEQYSHLQCDSVFIMLFFM